MKTKVSVSLMCIFTSIVLTLSGQENLLVVGLLNGTEARLINLDETKHFVEAKLIPGAEINNVRIQWVQDEEKYFLLAKVVNGSQSAIGLELGSDGEKLFALSSGTLQLECMGSGCWNCDWELANSTTLICKCSGGGTCEIIKTMPFRP